MTKTTGNFTDFVSFSRASGGTALRKISYGSELVTNGTFDTDTSGWTTIIGSAAWASGQISVIRSSGSEGRVAAPISCVVGKVYRLTLDRYKGTTASTTVNISISSVSTTGAIVDNNVITDGTSEIFFVATQTNHWVMLRTGSGVDGNAATFDNISVKEVLFDRADGTLQLFNYPTNVPRVEYDASGNWKGLLIEEARTNLLLRSEDVSNSSWVKGGGVTVGTPVQVAGISLDNIINTGTSNFRSIWQTFGAVANGGTATFSCYIKAGTAPETAIRIDDVGTGATSTRVTVPINWEGGVPTLGTPVLLGLTYVGANISLVDSAGMYRVSLTVQNNTGASLNLFAIYYVTWDGPVAAEDTYAGGFQTEVGAFPTSYIPTTGATATRAADICSIATSAFGYNQGAGTIVVEASMTGINSGVYPRIWDLGTATGTASLWANLSTVFLDKAGVGTVTSKAWTKDDTIAAAMSRQDSAIAIGASVSTSTTVVDLVAVNNLTIGASEGSSTQFLNGHIKSIAYYPRRLTNAQIQALTA